MNFKYVAFALLGGFMVMMSTLVYKAVSTDFYLVTDKYYEEGVNYDAKQAQLDNLHNLSSKVSLDLTDKTLMIQLPTAVSGGQIVLFRPANGDKDVAITLKPNQSLFTYDVSTLDKGKWIAKIEWNDQGKKYYSEKDFFVKE